MSLSPQLYPYYTHDSRGKLTHGEDCVCDVLKYSLNEGCQTTYLRKATLKWWHLHHHCSVFQQYIFLQDQRYDEIKGKS